MLHTNPVTIDGHSSALDLLQIVRGEFLEIPGLQLTRQQIQRLWGLDDQLCTTVLDGLTEARFLLLKPDGHYKRAGVHDLSAQPSFRGARMQRAQLPARRL
jgi:hypothetical protein